MTMMRTVLFLLAGAWLGRAAATEPLTLIRPQASFFSGSDASFARVVDGIAAGPEGWSVTGKQEEAQSLVVTCARPVEAAELDISLFFLAGRPFNYLAEFHLAFTTDETPSLQSTWRPLEILRFSSEAATLQRIGSSALRASKIFYNVNGSVPDEIYRLTAALPGKKATGFRVTAQPVVISAEKNLQGLSYYAPYDFTMTEFRVAIHRRDTTNIALHCPVRSSHPLYRNADGTFMRPEALTDGLPATIAHPGRLTPAQEFFFEIDLRQIVDIDHIGLRNRGDEQFHRLSRLKVALHQAQAKADARADWQGIVRADGSHPAAGALEIVRFHHGIGTFRGRYLRLSSEAVEDYTPQLAEVEVYPKTTPQVISIKGDGKKLDHQSTLEIPPGIRRIEMQWEIPQKAPTDGALFRWRIRGQSDEWVNSRSRVIEFPCPDVTGAVFEAQVLHSDGQWDQSLFQLPLIVRVHWWKNLWLRIAMMTIAFLIAIGVGMLWSRYRTARQVAALKAEAALANERARIARDMHDDVGGKLARLAMLGDLALHQDAISAHSSFQPLSTMTDGIREVATELEQVIWSLKPNHDCLHSLARRIYHYAEEFFSGTPIHCSFGSMQQIPDGISLTPETRNALFRSSKEALANIIKHSLASKAHIDIAWSDGQCLISIMDNGQGFVVDEASVSSYKNGLTNMRQRMGSVGGSFHIDSNSRGTTVRLGWAQP
ncbi:MAG: hypothetical protein EAZ81_09200 [Verrucomicrobia bacterium]|nr:MAG: hypothetical protein EAZ81_09200 [Verrucomicrobiota bacterium]